MVTLFRKMLDAKFPPFARGGERVTDYNGIERIAVNMNEAEFQGKGELFDETDLAQLTKHIINIPFEIIIVDNDSFDHSAEMVESEFEKITLLKNNQNYGFSKAVNQGVKIAKGDFK